MASKYVFHNGKKVIDNDEYQQRLIVGQTQDLDTAELAAVRAAPDFEPIGIGKPLLLELIAVYSGKLKTGLLGHHDDVLVTSAVKANIGSADAKPLAINLLKKNVEKNEHFSPGAQTQGSPVIYYTPGLTDSTLFFDLEATADSFKDQELDKLSQLLTGAGSLPVFAPVSQYLLAGGVVLEIFEKLGNALFETSAFLKDSVPFRFETGGVNAPQPENMLVHNDADGPEFPSGDTTLEQSHGDLYVAVNGKRYDGPAPYAIVNVDGKTRPDLKDFEPTRATSALLTQFYGKQSKPNAVIDTVHRALSLYNDYEYFSKAEALKKNLATLTAGSDAYKKALELLKGYAANITDAKFAVEIPDDGSNAAGDSSGVGTLS